MAKFTWLLMFFLILSTCSIFSEPVRGENPFTEALENAQIAYKRGELAASTLLLKYALEKDPTATRVYIDLANIYLEMGDFNEAREVLQKGLEEADQVDRIKGELVRLEVVSERGFFDPDELEAAEIRDFFFYRGLHYQQEGQWEKSIEDLKKAIEYDRHLIAAYYFLGLAYIELEEWENAESILEAGIRRDTSFTGINFLLGHLAFRREDYHSAYNYYLRTPANLRDSTVRERISLIQSLLPEPPDKPDYERRKEPVDFQKVEPVIDENIPLLRVALLTQGLQVSFQAGAPFSISDMDGQELHRGQEKTTYIMEYAQGVFYLTNLEGEELFSTREKHRLDIEDQHTTLHIFDVEYGEGYFWAGREDRQYRGAFIFEPRDASRFYLINEVNVEEYLYSVIPSEMPASWPMEALKAQTVAARSYTLNRYYRNPSANYHLVASVLNAAYNGTYWEHERSTEAVDATRGLIATYRGLAIDAVYSSNSGGFTEDGSLVWGGDVSYLKGQAIFPDHYELDLLPSGLSDWVKERPPSFSRAENFGSATSYRWTRVLLPQEPPVASRVGPITNIIPQERGNSGFVKTVLVQGEQGEEIISGDRIRGQLGGLKSNVFMVEPLFNDQGKPEFFLIWGGGWGHGVGLDQTASAQMAADGIDHADIIKLFYQGVDLEQRY